MDDSTVYTMRVILDLRLNRVNLDTSLLLRGLSLVGKS